MSFQSAIGVFVVAASACDAPRIATAPLDPPSARLEDPTCASARAFLARATSKGPPRPSRMCALGWARRAATSGCESTAATAQATVRVLERDARAERGRLELTSAGRWVVERLDDGAERIWQLDAGRARLGWLIGSRHVATVVGSVALLAAPGRPYELLDLETGARRVEPRIFRWTAHAASLVLVEDHAVRRIGPGLAEIGRIDAREALDPADERLDVVGDVFIGAGIVGDLAANRVLARGAASSSSPDGRRLLVCDGSELLDLEVATGRLRARHRTDPASGPCAGHTAAYVGADSRWLAWFELRDRALDVHVLDLTTGDVQHLRGLDHDVMPLQLAATPDRSDPDRFCLFTSGKVATRQSCDWVVRGGRPVSSKRRPLAAPAPGALEPGRAALLTVSSPGGEQLADLTYLRGRDPDVGLDVRLRVRDGPRGAIRCDQLVAPGPAVVSGPLGADFTSTFLEPTLLLVTSKTSAAPPAAIDLATCSTVVIPGSDVRGTRGPIVVVDGGSLFDVHARRPLDLVADEASLHQARRVECE